MTRYLLSVIMMVAVLAVPGRADQPDFQAQASGYRSLAETMWKLKAKTGWLICLEEPLWPSVSQAGPKARRNHLGAMEEPPPPDRIEVAVQRLRGKGAELQAVNEIVAAYNRQNPGRAYRAESVGSYITVIPEGMQGSSRVRGSMLSLEISVPVARRRPTQHAEELARALSSVLSVPVEIDTAGFGFLMDAPFAGRTGGEFEWGLANTTGRTALIDLISKSQTTIIWQVDCQAGVGTAPGRCMLSLMPRIIEIRDRQGRTTQRTLYYDRGTGPAIPPPPPPPGR